MSHRFPHIKLTCTLKKNLMCSVKKIFENSNFFFFFINAFCFIMFMTQLYSWLINQMYEVLARTFLLFLCSMINLANAWFGVPRKRLLYVQWKSGYFAGQCSFVYYCTHVKFLNKEKNLKVQSIFPSFYHCNKTG